MAISIRGVFILSPYCKILTNYVIIINIFNPVKSAAATELIFTNIFQPAAQK